MNTKLLLFCYSVWPNKASQFFFSFFCVGNKKQTKQKLKMPTVKRDKFRSQR